MSRVSPQPRAGRPAPVRAETPPAPPGLVPPLLPILVPLIVAAIVTGVCFAWWFPPVSPATVAPVPRFTDITAESGLGNYRPVETGADAPTTLGGGVVCFDYDGDGRTDLLFINGSAWPWEEPFAKRISRGSCALFHNDGKGRFTDVTAAAGLNVELQGMTAAAGDYDNDGRPDIFITCVGTNHLFHNLGGGRFEDVTESAGVGGEENTWSTGATWLDIDGDGKLDLVVAHYARWPADVELQAAFMVSAVGRSYGAPTGFVGAYPSVYRNTGDGHFVLVPVSAGLRDLDPQTRFPVAKTLAVVPVDANGDGKLDLIFTYQTNDSALFINQGDGTFRRWRPAADLRQEGISAGLAAASSLPFTPLGSVDPRFVAIEGALLHAPRPRADASLWLPGKLAVVPLDYDLNGRIELFSGGGRAEPDTNHFDENRDFAGRPEFWWNRGEEWSAVAPAPGMDGWAQPVIARGVATADFDGDGDLDVVIAQNGAGPRLLRNDQRLAFPWLQVDLVATRSCRQADGARVEVYTPRRIYSQTMAPAMGFMAQSASTLTFGLGEDARVRRVVVHWPSGYRQEIRSPAINRRMVITEE